MGMAWQAGSAPLSRVKSDTQAAGARRRDSQRPAPRSGDRSSVVWLPWSSVLQVDRSTSPPTLRSAAGASNASPGPLHCDDSHPGLLLTTRQGTVSAAKANTLPPGGRRRWEEVLYHAAPILLWDRPAREADVHLRAGRGRPDPCPSQWPRHSGALPHHHRGIPRGPRGGGGMHLHVVLEA